jgi:glycosyltransferase involved in cell wall biosynthesis
MEKVGTRKDSPLISLILATIGRTVEVERFLNSLDRQSYRSFELIVVDQNPDDRLNPILSRFGKAFPILHLRSSPGLSRARNFALPYIHGSIVGFPDDDCVYPANVLENVVQFFAHFPQYSGVSGRVRFFEGRGLGRFSRHPGEINPYNIWFRVTSFTLFFRTELLRKTGGFDESLGVGSGTPWGSSEDIELPLRAMRKGERLYYNPEIVVEHPYQLSSDLKGSWRRGLNYGRGIGRVLRIHAYPSWFIAYHLLRSCGGIVFSLLQGKGAELIFYIGNLLGKAQGITLPEGE